MRAVFMGTPGFAVPALEAATGTHEIAGVFTRPDKPVGRGMKVAVSPVKRWAGENGLPVFQPDSFRDGRALELLRTLSPDILLVVAYGRILPEDVLSLPPLGAVNVHGSLLPRLRGAAPVQWSVIRGDRETGVTTMHMAPALDTGDIILQEAVSLHPGETAGSLFDRLAPLGASLLVKTLDALARGAAPRVPQREELATYAPALTREMGRLDFTRCAVENERWVRGLSPRPGAWTPLASEGLPAGPLRIHAARAGDHEVSAPAGTVLLTGGTGLEIVCGDGRTLAVIEMQAPGGKRMPPEAYLRGHTLPRQLGL